MARDFREALREADRALGERGMPAPADRRLRERLGLLPGARTAPRWGLWLAAAGAAAAAVLVVARVVSPQGPQLIGGFEVLGPSSDFGAAVVAGSAVEIRSGSATLVDPARGVSLVVSGSGLVRREPEGVRVLRGQVETVVLRRAREAGPCRVLVSRGTIEVLGTRFTIEEHGEAGSVTLHEGSVRFLADDGREATLEPGETLAWPLPPPRPAGIVPAAAASPEPPVPAALPARPPHAAADRPAVEPAVVPPAAPGPTEGERVEALLSRIASLRSRGQYKEAVELIAAEQASFGAPTRELLGFEAGAILSNQVRDPARACAHWDEHQRRFPGGRYEAEIGQVRARLSCGR